MNGTPSTRRAAFSCHGYTLVELLTSMAILGVMLALLFSVFDNINKAWLTGENRVETFTQARAVLDLMSRELSQAVVTNIAFYGDSKHVYFVAPVDTNPQNQSDLCEIGYEFEQVDPANSKNWTFKLTRRQIAPTPQNCSGFPTSPWNPYASPHWWSVFFNGFAPTPINPATESTTVLASNCVFDLYFQYYDQNGNLLSVPYNRALNAGKLPYTVVINMTNVDTRTAVKLNAVPAPSLANQTWTTITNSTLRSFLTTVYLPNISPAVP